jgi:hypothetical protein
MLVMARSQRHEQHAPETSSVCPTNVCDPVIHPACLCFGSLWPQRPLHAPTRQNDPCRVTSAAGSNSQRLPVSWSTSSKALPVEHQQGGITNTWSRNQQPAAVAQGVDLCECKSMTKGAGTEPPGACVYGSLVALSVHCSSRASSTQLPCDCCIILIARHKRW